ncbi:MAG: hypothetical protein HXO82_03225 [Selenomonas sp.]|nr:hypothetical protein [Selenomonas sp.]
MRDVKSNALICEKISRRGRENNRLHTLLAEPLLLGGRCGKDGERREREEGDYEK